MRTIQRFLKDQRGATAIEYGLLAGLIAVSMIAGLTLYYEALQNLFTYIVDTINTALGL
ncbi:Flp family type IVb pilin [Allorhizobium undicola]|uniref:Flp family type IVb pilin n=1 Tax=Allorhizobium undicola TaxID=78527 RepID=UPI000A028B88|nr:Flp family type IVb pilin [Allorhizobium undicola]